MDRALWYLKRLALMEPREILHRIAEQGRVAAMRYAYRRSGPAAPVLEFENFSFCTSIAFRLPSLRWGDPADPAVLSGQALAKGYAWRWSGDPDDWRRAPDTGRLWPAGFFADIAYRAGNPHGDARMVWEPSRLQQLVALARLASEAGSEQADAAVAMIGRQLESWVGANPPWTGIHYVSAMECGLRLIAVCHALDPVRDRLGGRPSVWTGLLSIVASHAPFILRRLSLHSSAGNHTIAEAAALVYAGVLFPEFDEASRWKARGLGLLRREAARQVLPDGGGIERAFAYHRFVVDLLGLVEALLSHHGESVPADIADAVIRGRRFLAGIQTGMGGLAAVGDSDDGHALGAGLIWLVPGQDGESEPVKSFPDTGYTVMHAPNAPLSVLMDHGPLGMAPGFGHAHADALSIIACCDDMPLVVDPGTFTYTGDPEWRRYFRSTRAHNTIEVDGRDQARQESAFQWSRPYRCALVRSEADSGGCVRLLARNDGYESLGVVHWRGVAFRPDGFLIVCDWLAGTGVQSLALHWHCAIAPAAKDKGFRMETDGAPLYLAIDGGNTTMHRGEADPALGWISPAYGVRTPITTLRTEYCGELPHTFITLMGFSKEVFDPDATGDEIRVLREWTEAAAAR